MAISLSSSQYIKFPLNACDVIKKTDYKAHNSYDQVRGHSSRQVTPQLHDMTNFKATVQSKYMIPYKSEPKIRHGRETRRHTFFAEMSCPDLKENSTMPSWSLAWLTTVPSFDCNTSADVTIQYHHSTATHQLTSQYSTIVRLQHIS